MPERRVQFLPLAPLDPKKITVVLYPDLTVIMIIIPIIILFISGVYIGNISAEGGCWATAPRHKIAKLRNYTHE